MNARPDSRLRLGIDKGLWLHQLACLEALAPYVPKRRARKLRRKAMVAIALCIRDGGGKHYLPRAARIANHFVVEVRVPGMDEVIAAAFRAAKRHLVARGDGLGDALVTDGGVQ